MNLTNPDIMIELFIIIICGIGLIIIFHHNLKQLNQQQAQQKQRFKPMSLDKPKPWKK